MSIIVGIVVLWVLAFIGIIIVNGAEGKRGELAAVLFFTLLMASLGAIPVLCLLLIVSVISRASENKKVAYCSCGQLFRVYPPA